MLSLTKNESCSTYSHDQRSSIGSNKNLNLMLDGLRRQTTIIGSDDEVTIYKISRKWKKKKQKVSPYIIGCLGFSLFTVIYMMIGIVVVTLAVSIDLDNCQATLRQSSKSSLAFHSSPRSLAVGDFNKDNKLDIVVANSGKENIGIFFGDDNGTFIEQITYSTGFDSRPYSVTVNYFNNDSFLDIAVANYGINNIRIFFGALNATFDNQTIISMNNSRPLFITSEDFNNDTNLDIISVNHGTNDITIYLGYGNGSFANNITYFIGYDTIPQSVVVADFNEDKLLDIAIANYGTNNIVVCFGYGNGSFGPSKIYTTNIGSQPLSITAGDFNNDHILDLVVANYGTYNIGIFFGYNNGTFATQKLFTLDIGSRPQYVTIGDVNNDKQTDIVIVDSINGNVHVFPGYGNGTFSNLTTYFTGSRAHPFAAVVNDFNNDKILDIAVVNSGTDYLLILRGYSTSFSASKTQLSLGSSSRPLSVAVGYLNDDKHLDVVVTKLGSGSIGVLLGYGNGSFQSEISYPLQSGSSPYSICIADFNSDGRNDLAIANYGAHTVNILFGSSNGSFNNMKLYSTGSESFPTSVAVGLFNDDDILDIAVTNLRLSNVAIFLGYGNGSFANKTEYSTGTSSDPRAIVVADFNNDTKQDLAVANAESGTIGILYGNGDGTFREIILYSVGIQSHPNSIATGYINSDRWFDIVVADSTSDFIAILLTNDDGTFKKAIMYTDESFSNPSGLALADINYDNRLDIIVTNLGTNTVGIVAQHENGSFILERSYQLTSGSNPKGVAIGDLNNNTRWDIIVAESGIGSLNLLVRYISARFNHVSLYSTGSVPHPYSIAAGDFNHDRKSDLAIANSESNSIGVSLGYGNGSFKSPVDYFVGFDSFPQYVTITDINKDDKLDIITANSGSNSIGVFLGDGDGNFNDLILYPTKDGSQPYWVAIADFNNDDQLDFVVANQGRDNIGILFGYNYRSFENQEIYSNKFNLKPYSITTCDLNNDSYIDIAAAFTTSDNIGILFGYGDGKFNELITHSVGYQSYPHDILCIDINNDYILDIIVANCGSDTIGVLLGEGNGTFAPVITFSTGNNSCSYSVASGDFNNDNQTDIVVANYHGNNIGVLLGYGNGTFGNVTHFSTDDGSRPQSIAVRDINNDNITDVVVANFRKDNVGVFIGYGDGTFEKQVTYSTGIRSLPISIIVNDFNNDNQWDIAVSNKNSDNVGILYGYGNGSFAPIMSYSIGAGSSPNCIRSGDFNNDDIIDVTVSNPGTNEIVILYGLGNKRFILGPSYSTGRKSGPMSIAIGDFDGDNRLDITTANYLMNSIGIHISYGNESIGGVTTYSTGIGSRPFSVAVSDFNNDNKFDIVVANYGTNNIGIFLGHGDGTFDPMIRYPMGDNARPIEVAVADLNYDNQSDIVVANYGSDNIYFLFGNGNGSFTHITTYSTGPQSHPHGIAIGDLSDDNLLDIVIITSGSNRILLLHGYENGTYSNETSYTIGYNFHPYAIAMIDFDADGSLDIAVVNYDGDSAEILLNRC